MDLELREHLLLHLAHDCADQRIQKSHVPSFASLQ